MNREELADQIYHNYASVHAGDADKIADFILDNFETKQPATERVSAKEVFLTALSNSSVNLQDVDRFVKEIHEAAAAFNNFKPSKP